VNDPNAAARALILARLAASREELRRVLEPPTQQEGGAAAGSYPGGFPRSRTMQMLMSSRGLGTLGALAAGLLIARPALALRLLRMLPAGAVAKTLLMKAFTAMRSNTTPG
jgi:hypothetical protein